MMHPPIESRYSHLMADFDLRPRELAQHLREHHGIEPKPARKRYGREVWHVQHEHAHESYNPATGRWMAREVAP